MELITLSGKTYLVEISESAKNKMAELGATMGELKESLLSLDEDADDGDDEFIVIAPFGTIVGTIGEISVMIRSIVAPENVL